MFRLFATLLTLLPLAGLAQTPPMADVRPHELTIHGDTRVDPYYWLRDREDPEVIAYLQAENAYTAGVLASTEDIQEEIFQEIVGRMDPIDESVPYELNGYWYYTRYEEGRDYPIYCRREGSLDAPEEIMLNGNEMAEGHDYFALAGVTVSSDNQMVAFAVDTVGRRKYTIHFKELDTGELLGQSIPDVTPNLVWAEGRRVLFHAGKDPQTLRPHQIWRYDVEYPLDYAMVFEETDETYSCWIAKSKSREYLIIGSEHTLAAESRILPADEPFGDWQIFEPRERGHEYSIDHAAGRFLIRSNWDAQNFRLMQTTEPTKGRAAWSDVIPHREDVLLEGFAAFEKFLVIRERREGLPHLRVHADDGEPYELDFPDPTYSVFFDENPEIDTSTLRYVYSSMTTPWSTYDFDMKTREQELKKRDKVLGEFDPANYESQYLWANARDGKQVPISLVYRKDRFAPGKNPLILRGYGSYGSSSWAIFRPTTLSLLDRGFVYAVAHIRGGQELGRDWYEDGKMFHKKNSFTDFIDCARHLKAEGWADPGRVYAYGGSAGGLLIGAVINMAPEDFHGAIARVPFVDVVTTMLDESIPLTTGEFDEWGNPKNVDSYEYMLSYSPYDQVAAQDYPHLLVTTGLHDSQVQYWEPAKWVAKLRATKTDTKLLLLHTNMEAGHGGASGRYARERETAMQYAFLLELAQRTNGTTP